MPKVAKKAKKAKVLLPLPADARLISLDVSSAAIGWSIWSGTELRRFGLIKSPHSWDSARRIEANTDRLETIVSWEATAGPFYVAMENQSHKTGGRFINIQGLAVLGQSQGEVSHMVRKYNPVLFDKISERTWTAHKGKGVKKVIRAEQVRLLFPEYAAAAADPKFDPGLDIADAVGLGLWRLSIKEPT